jgi:hypothetical protein
MNRILSNLNPLTEFAIVFVSLAGAYFQLKWTRRGTALGPTLLTTLGIFFCFLGIALGLADFNPNDVKNSVPHLLQGIRTSFWVSVCGIGWALTIKIRVAMLGDPEVPSAERADGATVDDLASLLIKLNTAVGGARSDSNERLEKLSAALDSSQQRAAEQQTRLLVQALAEVVRDFNLKLMEQFGDNFRELNAGVERLVAWQDLYQRQLDQLILQESASRQAMAEAAQHFSDLVASSRSFIGAADSLSALLGRLDVQREGVTTGFERLADLIDKASHGLPKIEQHIVDMTNQIARGVQSNQETLGAALKSSWQSVQVHNQHLAALLAKSLESADRDVSAYARQSGERAKSVG